MLSEDEGSPRFPAQQQPAQFACKVWLSQKFHILVGSGGGGKFTKIRPSPQPSWQKFFNKVQIIFFFRRDWQFSRMASCRVCCCSWVNMLTDQRGSLDGTLLSTCVSTQEPSCSQRVQRAANRPVYSKNLPFGSAGISTEYWCWIVEEILELLWFARQRVFIFFYALFFDKFFGGFQIAVSLCQHFHLWTQVEVRPIRRPGQTYEFSHSNLIFPPPQNTVFTFFCERSSDQHNFRKWMQWVCALAIVLILRVENNQTTWIGPGLTTIGPRGGGDERPSFMGSQHTANPAWSPRAALSAVRTPCNQPQAFITAFHGFQEHVDCMRQVE